MASRRNYAIAGVGTATPILVGNLSNDIVGALWGGVTGGLSLAVGQGGGGERFTAFGVGSVVGGVFELLSLLF